MTIGDALEDTDQSKLAKNEHLNMLQILSQKMVKEA